MAFSQLQHTLSIEIHLMTPYVLDFLGNGWHEAPFCWQIIIASVNWHLHNDLTSYLLLSLSISLRGLESQLQSMEQNRLWRKQTKPPSWIYRNSHAHAYWNNTQHSLNVVHFGWRNQETPFWWIYSGHWYINMYIDSSAFIGCTGRWAQDKTCV